MRILRRRLRQTQVLDDLDRVVTALNDAVDRIEATAPIDLHKCGPDEVCIYLTHDGRCALAVGNAIRREHGGP